MPTIKDTTASARGARSAQIIHYRAGRSAQGLRVLGAGSLADPMEVSLIGSSLRPQVVVGVRGTGDGWEVRRIRMGKEFGHRLRARASGTGARKRIGFGWAGFGHPWLACRPGFNQGCFPLHKVPFRFTVFIACVSAKA